MLERIWDYFYSRAANSERVHPIYILPTLDGLKVVVLNIVLLVMGLVYANNYVLLFNFLLFCLFLGSMFYTHFNISGLKLESAQFSSVHVNEDGILNLYFSSANSQGHFFIRPSFKSQLVKINNDHQSFPINSKHLHLKISIKGSLRGCEKIKSLYVETLFPFNFFRCFTFFKINQECYVYPEAKNLHLHTEEELTENTKQDGDDFYLRDYLPGDSLKRVDWKKLAQTNRWYTRQFQNTNPSPVMLILDKTPVEETLQSICFAIHTLHHQNIRYGLKLKSDVIISPENSPRHLTRCLKELAVYET